MNNALINFSAKLLFVLFVAFVTHIFILKYSGYAMLDNKIVLSYIVNAVLAILIFGFLFKMKEKLKGQLGFLFLGGSVLKFAVFFIVFYPAFKADGTISKLEFAAFFVPYVLCLVTETFGLSKWLNKMN
tara:strand:- start:3163 stop:3549 length:387 start_codon:yes stop_codon:yes gene_type:complete